MTPFIFALVVVLAAAFAFLNGFRDVSNSVAVAVRTRALTPTVAVLLAAVFNFVGALLSAGLAVAISQNWVTLPQGDSGLTVLVAGLASACIWGLSFGGGVCPRPPPMRWLAGWPAPEPRVCWWVETP